MKTNRRSFFKLLGSATVLTPFFKVSQVFAEAAKGVMPKSAAIKAKMIDDKTSKRLSYVADSALAKKGHSSSDKNFAKYKEGSMCGNCKFYKSDKGEPEWGKCTMAANRYVYTKGWCKSYSELKK